MWNIPFLASPQLIAAALIPRLERPYHYHSEKYDADMSFALYARHKVR